MMMIQYGTTYRVPQLLLLYYGKDGWWADEQLPSEAVNGRAARVTEYYNTSTSTSTTASTSLKY